MYLWDLERIKIDAKQKKYVLAKSYVEDGVLLSEDLIKNMREQLVSDWEQTCKPIQMAFLKRFVQELQKSNIPAELTTHGLDAHLRYDLTHVRPVSDIQSACLQPSSELGNIDLTIAGPREWLSCQLQQEESVLKLLAEFQRMKVRAINQNPNEHVCYALAADFMSKVIRAHQTALQAVQDQAHLYWTVPNLC